MATEGRQLVEVRNNCGLMIDSDVKNTSENPPKYGPMRNPEKSKTTESGGFRICWTWQGTPGM